MKKLLIYDRSNPMKLWVNNLWPIGASIFKSSFDEVVGVSSIAEFFLMLHAHKPDHVQLWGHALSGEPMIGLDKLSAKDPRWAMRDIYEVWFRSCSVAQGKEGVAFMRNLAEQRIDVAAHLSDIGYWGLHSNLVGVRAGETPWWSEDLKPGPSSPLQPRTVSAARMCLPRWTYRKHPPL
ncbi:MAG: hypothetical protein H0U59_13155 [Gemmatimonadaceae bacterium]|nr:hypothetical protein [Gemmatimonadaceae bacterium]